LAQSGGSVRGLVLNDIRRQAGYGYGYGYGYGKYAYRYQYRTAPGD